MRKMPRCKVYSIPGYDAVRGKWRNYWYKYQNTSCRFLGSWQITYSSYINTSLYALSSFFSSIIVKW